MNEIILLYRVSIASEISPESDIPHYCISVNIIFKRGTVKSNSRRQGKASKGAELQKEHLFLK